ncbi:MAG: FecR domain-containing protein [Candidatus Omnitrophota bacterium]|nr:FecR domain-containing protein [Candidatus Omnitrophota bacterium]
MLSFLAFAFFISFSYPYPLKIVDTEGSVFFKKESKASWVKSQKSIILDKKAELRTERASVCTVSLDDKLDNVLTIKENSQIYIENIKPVAIYIVKGRTFALIDDITTIGAFEIHTQRARLKVRGTGESVDVSDKEVIVKCFEDNVYLNAIDEKSNITGERTIAEGFGIKIDIDGVLGDIFELSEYDFAEWDEFTNDIGHIRANKDSSEDRQFLTRTLQ